MDTIIVNISTAANLIGQSERTLRRRIADGLVPRKDDGSYRTMIPYEYIRDQVIIPFSDEELRLVQEADQGAVQAQVDLATIFLSHDQAKAAIYWLELAAKQNAPEGMHLLAGCYINGVGLPLDENAGLMWLFKAASQGHAIAQAQAKAIRGDLVK